MNHEQMIKPLVIGVGIGDLGEATAADPADLFSFATGDSLSPLAGRGSG